MPEEKTAEQIEAEKREQDAIAARQAAEKPATPPAEYITRDAFMEFQRTQNEQFERLISALAPRETPKPEPTVNYDAEIAKAEEEGNTARATELRVAKATKPLLDRIQNFEQFGVSQLETIASEVALPTESDRQYYQRHKKEVDAVRAGMPAQFRTSPESLRTALTFVKGQNREKDFAEARETWAREAAGRKDTEGSKPPVESSRGKKPDALPTPAEYFNNDETKLSQIESMGGPDKFVQKTSGGRYKDWNSWVRKSLVLVGKPVPEEKKAS